MVRRTTAQTRRPHVRTSPIKPIRRPTVAAAASSSAFAAARGGTTTGHRLPPPAKRARHVVGSSARLLSSGSSSSELSEPDTASSAAGGGLAAEEDDDDDLESDDPLSSLSPPPPSSSAAAHQRRRARGSGGALAAAAGPSPATHAGKKRKRGQAEDATVVARGWQGGRRLRTSSDDGWEETEADADEDIETQAAAESGGLSGEEVLAGEDDDDGDGSFEADEDTCSVGSHLDGSLDGGSEGLDDAEGEYDLIDPTDDLLINEATREQLMRRKRAELLRLSRVAGLLDADANNSSLIKSHLVDGILATRSSRPTTTSTPLRSTSRVLSLSDASSDQDPTPQRPLIASNKRISNRSQDDDPGNEAGGEETEWDGPAADAADKTTRRLGRRTTSGPVRTPSQAGNSKSGRALSGRSKSMGGLGGATDGRKTRFSADVEIPAALGSKRRHSSNVPVSSPTTPAPSSQSPRKTRASRARPAKPTDRRRRGSRPSPMKRNRHVAFPDVVMDPLDEEDGAAVGGSSSHRSGSGQSSTATRKGKEREVFKATPGRKAKTAALEALQGGESSTSASEDNYDSMTVDEDDAVVIVEGDTASKSRSRRPSTRSSHPVVSPVRPSPKRRGSSRAALSSESQPGQMPTPPSDGDDESSDDEAAAAGAAMDEQQQPAKGDRRMLRRASSRKSIIEISEDEEEEIAEVDMVTADGSEDEGGEGDDDEDDRTVMGDDEVPEIDLDFENATHSQLVRLRKDDLVRLCETRSLDIAGTKPQLAQALLEWRETAASSRGSSPPESAAPSSNSSQATARQHSSTRSTRRRPHAGDPVFATNAKVTPELLKGDHVHQVSHEQAATPPPSEHAHQGTGGEDLSLDLESLGLEDKEIPCDQLIKMEKVGSGGFKDVYVGKLRNRLKVAIAEFRGQLSEMDIKELKLLAEFTHPNVVKFLGVSIPEDRRIPIMMISELCENGDLFDYIRNVPAPPTKIVIKLMLDIARGLAYLHCRDKPVIHRDVKSSNILITSKVVAKVGDFGLARVKHSTRSMIRSLVGTVCYQPPEMWTAHPKYDSKVDVYSCAMVFWEMLQWHKAEKKFPWEGMNEHAIYDTVGAKKLRPSTHKLRSVWGSDVVDLMEEMWAQDPKERPSMTTVVERLVEYHRIA